MGSLANRLTRCLIYLIFKQFDWTKFYKIQFIAHTLVRENDLWVLKMKPSTCNILHFIEAKLSHQFPMMKCFSMIRTFIQVVFITSVCFLLFILIRVRLIFRQKYQAPQVRPDLGSNSWPPDNDSTFHVTETSAVTTWPSLISKEMCCHIILEVGGDFKCTGSLFYTVS